MLNDSSVPLALAIDAEVRMGFFESALHLPSPDKSSQDFLSRGLRFVERSACAPKVFRDHESVPSELRPELFRRDTKGLYKSCIRWSFQQLAAPYQGSVALMHLVPLVVSRFSNVGSRFLLSLGRPHFF